MAIDRHPHGAPCWFELVSFDLEAAQAFYGELFGWQISAAEDADAGSLHIHIDGERVGAMYAMDPALVEEGLPAHWAVYFAVDDIHQVVERAREEGGEVLVDPSSVGHEAMAAILADPEGASFGLWQAGENAGAELMGPAGSVTWVELATRDAQDAGDFYAATLGWSVAHQPADAAGAYASFGDEHEDWGGLLSMDEQWEGVPSHWALYFAVDDLDAMLERARALGANMVGTAMEVEQVGRLASIVDPEGAALHLMQRFAPE